MACGYDNLTETVLRAAAVVKVKGTDTFGQLINAFTRANNLAKKAEDDTVDEGLFETEAEKLLWNDLKFAEEAIVKLTNARQFVEALVAISTLEPAINDFFDKVMVMAEDEKIKNNRLALLLRVSRLLKDLADLTKICLLYTSRCV